MLKAILFDLDDTLIDWSGFDQDWPTFEQKYLRRVVDYIIGTGYEQIDFTTFVHEFRIHTREAWSAGRGNLIAPNLGDILMETAEILGVPPGQITALDCLESYEWRAVPGTTVFPDVINALKLFRRNKIRMGIVTNAAQPMWLRDFELKGHGLLDFFPECRISAADVGFLKPHPAIFQAALDALQIDASEAVFVGDNPVADIAGAQAVGLRAVLRVTHPAPPMLSGLIVPDGAVNSLREMFRLLDDWYPGWRKK